MRKKIPIITEAKIRALEARNVRYRKRQNDKVSPLLLSHTKSWGDLQNDFRSAAQRITITNHDSIISQLGDFQVYNVYNARAMLSNSGRTVSPNLQNVINPWR